MKIKEKWTMPNYLKDGGKEKLLALRAMPEFRHLPNTILVILLNRGIDTPEKIRNIFSFSEADIPDVRLIKDIDKCVDSIMDAINKELNIVVFADYDVDGVGSGSILTNCIRNIGGKVNYFTSNRFEEGYGITAPAVDRMMKEFPETQFVITVDNGIVAFDGINKLTEYGIQSVVIDHHEPSDTGEIPNCLAVCDVKQSDDMYPFKDLCAGGLAYKVMRYMYDKHGYNTKFVDEQLDLVALTTVADMVSLIDENRYYVKKGLELIKDQTRLSLAILVNEIRGSMKSEIDESFIGFYIAPTINAVGRMEGTAMKALELFTTNQRHIMDNNSHALVSLNQKRKDATTNEFDIANQFIEDNHKDDLNVIVVHNDEFQEGLVGLVAGRIKEQYKKPTIVLTKNGDIYKGSARSVEGFNIKEVLDGMKDILIGYGGHAMAAGLSIEEKNIDEFERRLNKKATELNISQEQTIVIDNILKPADVTIQLIDVLEALKPFGQGFQKPVFGLVADIEYRNAMGKGENPPHLKLTDKSGLNILDFNGVANYEELGSPIHIKCIGYPDKNVFRNKETPQFFIDGHRIKENL